MPWLSNIIWLIYWCLIWFIDDFTNGIWIRFNERLSLNCSVCINFKWSLTSGWLSVACWPFGRDLLSIAGFLFTDRFIYFIRFIYRDRWAPLLETVPSTAKARLHEKLIYTDTHTRNQSQMNRSLMSQLDIGKVTTTATLFHQRQRPVNLSSTLNGCWKSELTAN